MKRYFGEEPEDEDQFYFEDDDFEDEEEGQVAYIDSDGLVEMMHMDLAQTELNQQLLSEAIDLAKQSFFWKFKSTPNKLKDIKKIYRQLMRMTDEDDEDDEGDE